MKRILKHARCGLAAVLALTAAGCGGNDDEPQPEVQKPSMPDLAPVSVEIMLADSKGNNLLNPEAEGNWMNTTISATYNGHTYSLDWNVDEHNRHAVPSRAEAVFEGLTLTHFRVAHGAGSILLTNQYALAFGEFTAYSNYTENFTLNFAETRAQYTFTVVHKFGYNEQTREAVESTEVLVNGQPAEMSNGYVVLTLPSRALNVQ